MIVQNHRRGLAPFEFEPFENFGNSTDEAVMRDTVSNRSLASGALSWRAQLAAVAGLVMVSLIALVAAPFLWRHFTAREHAVAAPTTVPGTFRPTEAQVGQPQIRAGAARNVPRHARDRRQESLSTTTPRPRSSLPTPVV